MADTKVEIPETVSPDLARVAAEYHEQLERARATAALSTRSSRRADAGRKSIEDSPVFGGERQGELF